jgi:hypothetical protein
MKPGKEYEQFVYEKLRRFFPDALVTLNDRIAGRESGLPREIDVSVRMSVENAELLYIVQCKDWSSPVDVNTLGALSAVMQDVGAAKGFLLCTSGFYATNYKYAQSRGIELVTIEDIESDKWTTTVQVPYVYVRRQNDFKVSIEIRANDALVEANRDRNLVIDLREMQVRAKDLSPIGVRELIAARCNHPNARDQPQVRVDLTAPDLEVQVAGIWAPCPHLSLDRRMERRRYLKYLTPTAYSQLRDHVRGTTLPLHVRLEQVGAGLDDTFVEMAANAPPEFPGLWIEVEESSFSADSVQFNRIEHAPVDEVLRP